MSVSTITPTSTWSPLRQPVFRALWIASAVSSVGTWMHDVGAAWLMTSLSPSPFLVALMQAASSLPFFLLALPAGAIAKLGVSIIPSQWNWRGYKDEVRRRSEGEDGLTENLDFGNPCLAGACLCSCGFNRPVQDMSTLTHGLECRKSEFPCPVGCQKNPLWKLLCLLVRSIAKHYMKQITCDG